MVEPVFSVDGPGGPPPPIYPNGRVDMGFGPPHPHHSREDPGDPASWSDPDCFIPQHRYHYHNSRKKITCFEESYYFILIALGIYS